MRDLRALYRPIENAKRRVCIDKTVWKTDEKARSSRETQRCLVRGARRAGEAKGVQQWDVCKSPGFPGNRVAAGQVDPPAVRITMVCSLFACCLSAFEAFIFLSGAVCWVFSNAYTKEEHLLVFS